SASAAVVGSPSPSISGGSAVPPIPIATLEGKILFTRAGGHFGDETVFTANADGTDERRITDFGVHCCPRWASDGQHVFMAASAPDGRITTAIADPDGSHLRLIPLPSGTLNLGCFFAYSLATDRLACEGWSDPDPA